MFFVYGKDILIIEPKYVKQVLEKCFPNENFYHLFDKKHPTYLILIKNKMCNGNLTHLQLEISIDDIEKQIENFNKKQIENNNNFQNINKKQIENFNKKQIENSNNFQKFKQKRIEFSNEKQIENNKFFKNKAQKDDEMHYKFFQFSDKLVYENDTKGFLGIQAKEIFGFFGNKKVSSITTTVRDMCDIYNTKSFIENLQEIYGKEPIPIKELDFDLEFFILANKLPEKFAHSQFLVDLFAMHDKSFYEVFPKSFVGILSAFSPKATKEQGLIGLELGIKQFQLYLIHNPEDYNLSNINTFINLLVESKKHLQKMNINLFSSTKCPEIEHTQRKMQKYVEYLEEEKPGNFYEIANRGVSKIYSEKSGFAHLELINNTPEAITNKKEWMEKKKNHYNNNFDKKSKLIGYHEPDD